MSVFGFSVNRFIAEIAANGTHAPTDMKYYLVQQDLVDPYSIEQHKKS